MDKNAKLIIGTVAGFVAGTFITAVRDQYVMDKRSQKFNLIELFMMKMGRAFQEMEDRGINIPEDIMEDLSMEAKFTEIALNEV